MRATQHPSNNDVLGAPKGWDQQGGLPCNAIPITRMENNGTPVVVTFWRPTEEEIEDLKAGALIALHVVGQTMPPVAIEVHPVVA